MPGVVIVLVVAVVLATVGTMLKVKREKAAPLRAVIALYGFGLLAVLVIGGEFYRRGSEDNRATRHAADVRAYDQCYAAVVGRGGVREHFEYLYGVIGGPRADGQPVSPQTQAFLDGARADLDLHLPARTLAECGEDPDPPPPTPGSATTDDG